MSRKTVREIKMLGLEKRRFPNKHYVYILEVHWSTGATNKIYRRYSQFFEFQLAILQQFPIQGGKKNPEDRIIPFLPGKILFGRSHIRDVAEQRQGPISEYIAKLVALPHEVSESQTVNGFFEPTDEDIKPTRERAKKSVRETEIHNISDPVLLEQWVVIGDFKKEKRSECNLREGDVVDVIEKKATGWWFVDNAGNQGWVPASYLEAGSGVQDDEVERCAIGEEEDYITNNSYIAQNSDELGFERGVIVLVLQKNYDGWWLCRYQGREGLIPAAYLEPNTQDLSKSGRSLPRENKTHSTLPTSASMNLAEINSPRNWKSTKRSNEIDERSNPTLAKSLGPTVTAKTFIPRRDSVRQTSMRNRKERECKVQQKDRRIPDHNIDEFIALGEYESEDADGLSFKEGDILEVVEKHDNGWWWASIRGKAGWVPSTYLEKSKTQRYSGDPTPATMALRSNLLGMKPKRCTAKGAFNGQTQDTLSFKAGEVFEIVEKSDTGWWYLKNAKGQEGWAPDDLVVEGESVKPPKPAPVPMKKISPMQSFNSVTPQIQNSNQTNVRNKPNAFSLENKVQLKPISANKPTIVEKPSLPSKPSVPTIPEKSLNPGKEGVNKPVSLREVNKPVAPGKPPYAKVKIRDSDSDKPVLPTRPRPSLVETNPPKPSSLKLVSPRPIPGREEGMQNQLSPRPNARREEGLQNQLSGLLAKRQQSSAVQASNGKPTLPTRPLSQNLGQSKPGLPARNPDKPSLPVRPTKPADTDGAVSSLPAYVTTRDYRALDEGCLSFRSGERAELVERGDTGWWWMRVRKDEGWVSEEMVRLEETEKRAAPKPNGGLVALEDYQADFEASLSFRKGDRIEVLDRDNGSGWTWVRIGREEGWAPTNLISQS